jgi:hypothetical protein
MKLKIILGMVLLLVACGACCFFLLLYERVSVIVLPPSEQNQIVIGDSSVIRPYLSIEGETWLLAAIRFEHIPDSIFLKNLDVKITSSDNPNQIINLSHVLAYKDTIIWEDVNNSLIRAFDFNDLPDHYKLLSRKREDNVIMFRFKTSETEKSKLYNFKITGSAVFHGRPIYFEKEIKAKRKKEWVLYQMMT